MLMGARKYHDFEVRGVRYATVRDCAEALGVSHHTVRRALLLRRLDTLGQGRAAIARAHCVPVRIQGRDFPSIKAAAAHHGVTPGAIHGRLERGTLEFVGRRRPGAPNQKAVKIAGRHFPSLSAASRAAGFAPTYLSQAIRLGRARAIGRISEILMAQALTREFRDAA